VRVSCRGWGGEEGLAERWCTLDPSWTRTHASSVQVITQGGGGVEISGRGCYSGISTVGSTSLTCGLNTLTIALATRELLNHLNGVRMGEPQFAITTFGRPLAGIQ
jgi:hypothetical protein